MQKTSPKKAHNLLLRVARNSLIILTPVIWVAGISGAFFHVNVTILNHPINDMPSFIYCILAGPFAAVVTGFAIWILFIAPFQFLFWLWNRAIAAMTAARYSLFPDNKAIPDPRA